MPNTRSVILACNNICSLSYTEGALYVCVCTVGYAVTTDVHTSSNKIRLFDCRPLESSCVVLTLNSLSDLKGSMLLK